MPILGPFTAHFKAFWGSPSVAENGVIWVEKSTFLVLTQKVFRQVREAKKTWFYVILSCFWALFDGIYGHFPLKPAAWALENAFEKAYNELVE